MCEGTMQQYVTEQSQHIGYAISERWEMIVGAAIQMDDSGNVKSAHAFLNVGGRLAEE